MKLTKAYTFEAGHVLPFHTGKCGRPHGHSYVLHVTIEGDIKPDDGSPDSGMVMDFAEISQVLKPLIAGDLDHYWLNESLEMKNPTAERIVEWVVEKLQPQFSGLCAVRLYETATGWVDWER